MTALSSKSASSTCSADSTSASCPCWCSFHSTGSSSEWSTSSDSSQPAWSELQRQSRRHRAPGWQVQHPHRRRLRLGTAALSSIDGSSVASIHEPEGPWLNEQLSISVTQSAKWLAPQTQRANSSANTAAHPLHASCDGALRYAGTCRMTQRQVQSPITTEYGGIAPITVNFRRRCNDSIATSQRVRDVRSQRQDRSQLGAVGAMRSIIPMRHVPGCTCVSMR